MLINCFAERGIINAWCPLKAYTYLNEPTTVWSVNDTSLEIVYLQQPLLKDQTIIPADGQRWCNVFKTFLRRLASVKQRRVSTRINLQNAARRMWTCVKPEHRLYRVKFWIVVINFHPLSTNFQSMEPFQICLNCNLSTFQFLVFGKDAWN